MSESRKIAAILVADVVDYSRLASDDDEGTLARLRALLSDLIDLTIAARHGRVVKRTGHGSIVEFRSVVNALRDRSPERHDRAQRWSARRPTYRIRRPSWRSGRGRRWQSDQLCQVPEQ